MGVILLAGQLAGIVGGVIISTILTVLAVTLASKAATRRKHTWWFFGAATTILATILILAVNAYPWPTVRPGSDYDIAMKNLFFSGLAYTTCPGVAAILAAVATLVLPKKAVLAEPRPPSTS